MRPRRPQARLAPRLSWRRPLPTSTRSPRRARASDKSLEAVGPVMRTGTIESAGRRVVGAPPSLHVECLEAHGATASAFNMTTMATRHRTSTPSIPPVAVVPVVSSVKWFNVAITSTDTRPADGSASRPSAKAAILRGGGGVKGPPDHVPQPKRQRTIPWTPRGGLSLSQYSKGDSVVPPTQAQRTPQRATWN